MKRFHKAKSILLISHVLVLFLWVQNAKAGDPYIENIKRATAKEASAGNYEREADKAIANLKNVTTKKEASASSSNYTALNDEDDSKSKQDNSEKLWKKNKESYKTAFKNFESAALSRTKAANAAAQAAEAAVKKGDHTEAAANRARAAKNHIKAAEDYTQAARIHQILMVNSSSNTKIADANYEMMRNCTEAAISFLNGGLMDGTRKSYGEGCDHAGKVYSEFNASFDARRLYSKAADVYSEIKDYAAEAKSWTQAAEYSWPENKALLYQKAAEAYSNALDHENEGKSYSEAAKTARTVKEAEAYRANAAAAYLKAKEKAAGKSLEPKSEKSEQSN